MPTSKFQVLYMACLALRNQFQKFRKNEKRKQLQKVDFFLLIPKRVAAVSVVTSRANILVPALSWIRTLNIQAHVILLFTTA